MQQPPTRIPGVFTTQAAPPRAPVYYTEERRRFPLDYKNRNFVYFFSNGPFILTVSGYATISYPANAWMNVPFPETTEILSTADSIIVQCVDEPIVDPTVFVPRRVNEQLEIDQQDVGNSWSSGPLSGTEYSELAIDFTIYAIQGGTTPTVTFLVSRIGLDGQLYQLEKHAGLSAPGQISYSIGAGLDGKSFMALFQVDMVTTGNPANVNLSGSIFLKQ